MMLHVRDCSGTTVTDDVCPFPWCRKVKHLLYHLLSCTVPQECAICIGSDMEYNTSRLRHLNAFRMKAAREKLLHQFNEKQKRCSTVGKKEVSFSSTRTVPTPVYSELPKNGTDSLDRPVDGPKLNSEGANNAVPEQPPTLPSSVVCIERTNESAPFVSEPTTTAARAKVDPPSAPPSIAENAKIEENPKVVIVAEDVPEQHETENSGQSIAILNATTSGQPDETPSESLAVR